jgi:hypothetical protein
LVKLSSFGKPARDAFKSLGYGTEQLQQLQGVLSRGDLPGMLQPPNCFDKGAGAPLSLRDREALQPASTHEAMLSTLRSVDRRLEQLVSESKELSPATATPRTPSAVRSHTRRTSYLVSCANCCSVLRAHSAR